MESVHVDTIVANAMMSINSIILDLCQKLKSTVETISRLQAEIEELKSKKK